MAASGGRAFCRTTGCFLGFTASPHPGGSIGPSARTSVIATPLSPSPPSQGRTRSRSNCGTPSGKSAAGPTPVATATLSGGSKPTSRTGWMSGGRPSAQADELVPSDSSGDSSPSRPLTSGSIPSSGQTAPGWAGRGRAPRHDHVASLFDRESERSYGDIRSASLMETRIIADKRVGRVAHGTLAASAEAQLRERGLRLTAPRKAVLELLQSTTTHPTAEEVHRLVVRRAPRASLGTVYRNLRQLVAAGLIGEVPGPRARFDANIRVHHHFTCLRCGRIADVEAPVAEPHSRALSKRVEARTGLTITHHRIDFFGRCRECQAPRRARPGRRGPAADARARAAHRPDALAAT